MDLAPFSNLPPLPSFDVIILPANLSLPAFLNKLEPAAPHSFPRNKEPRPIFDGDPEIATPIELPRGEGRLTKPSNLLTLF